MPAHETHPVFAADIVTAALNARTRADADAVQVLIAEAVGGTFRRPVGDRWGNQGLLTQSGSSYDHKILEPVTNMHDAVLTRYALARHDTLAAVRYRTPTEAAHALLGDLGPKDQAKLATVDIDHGTPSTAKGAAKSVTIMMRDYGIGMRDHDVPLTIFQLGSSSKDGTDWLNGTYCLGGATTYRNAASVILVTRPSPEALRGGGEDRISVAVVQWGRERTTVNATYLVTRPWPENPDAPPFSAPAGAFPDFPPGTYLALIDYESRGLGVRSGDERSFDTVANTRLFRPVMATGYTNHTTRGEARFETLDGLERRLNDNPGPPGSDGRQDLPFKHDGTTYPLPVRYRVFSKPDQPGARRRSVAQNHAVLLTSNGQVHNHWDPPEFRRRTRLPKLSDRILVIVETDALPIEFRTELFTPDRTQLVQSAAAIRLEKEIAEFLNNWPDLIEENNALVREAITGDVSNDRPTLPVAQRIARAVQATSGFSLAGGNGAAGGGPKPPTALAPTQLREDPTYLKGPRRVEAQTGRVKGVFLTIDAVDDFFSSGRGELRVDCEHPEIGEDEITSGELRDGRLRLAIAVPEDFTDEDYALTVTVPPWLKTSGGLSDPLTCTITLRTVDTSQPRPTGRTSPGDRAGSGGAQDGGLVALVWTDETRREGWNPNTVGEVERVPSRVLAEKHPEYKELATLDAEIPTITLNQDFKPLKAYISARVTRLGDTWRDQARDRFAVGTGVAMVLQEQDRLDAQANNTVQLSEEQAKRALNNAARAVLAMMPAYDELAREAGLEPA